MTADQRLDQLEPLISEALTVLDRHTLQLKQLTNSVSNITTVLIQQSDNISFLLREHIIIKDDIAEIKADIAGLKTDVASLKTDVTLIKQNQEAMQTEFGSKLDLILTKLQ